MCAYANSIVYFIFDRTKKPTDKKSVIENKFYESKQPHTIKMMEQNGYAVDYGDAYMEQEEEWEREGLLDPAWEKQQKKVNTNISIRFPFSTFFYSFYIFLSIIWSTISKCISSQCMKFNSRNIKLKWSKSKRNNNERWITIFLSIQFCAFSVFW